MPYNDKKVVKLLMGKCQEVEQRHPGYTESIQDLVGDVLMLEKEHSVAMINIKKKIADKISAAGKDLYTNKSKDNE